MSKNTTLLLIVWNLALSALVAWGLLRSSNPGSDRDAVAADSTALDFPLPTVNRDTGALKESRIAYFRMDSLSKHAELFKAKNAHLEGEVRRLESGLQREQDKARQRYEELRAKDRTYSTQAEIDKDEMEMQERMGQLQKLQADGEERIAGLQNDILVEVSEEVNNYLKAYNAAAGFDFIFSIQGNGQIWVGNEGLNITDELVDGLNARYAAGKTKK